MPESCPDHFLGDRPLDQVADRVLERSDAERRREPGDEGGMAEHLALVQEVDHDLIVEELHSPGPHHVEEPRGRSPRWN